MVNIQELKEKANKYIDENSSYDAGRKERLKLLVEKILEERGKQE